MRCRRPLVYDYVLHSQPLEEKDAVKYLGVTVHHKLSWNEHICNIVKKANSSIGFLRRNLQTHQRHIKSNNNNNKRLYYKHPIKLHICCYSENIYV